MYTIRIGLSFLRVKACISCVTRLQIRAIVLLRKTCRILDQTIFISETRYHFITETRYKFHFITRIVTNEIGISYTFIHALPANRTHCLE